MTPSLCSGNNNNNFRIWWWWWWWQGSYDRVDKRKSRTHKYHECAIGRTEIEQRGDRFSFLANHQIWISQWCHCTRIFNIGIHCNLIGCWCEAPSTRINRTSHVDRQDQRSLIDMWVGDRDPLLSEGESSKVQDAFPPLILGDPFARKIHPRIAMFLALGQYKWKRRRLSHCACV